MKNLLPQVFRKRLIIEGFYEVNINEEFIKKFLNELCGFLKMNVIVGPLIFSPNEKSEVHKGLGGFMAWVESGVTLYTWNIYKFFTLDIYSCKDFNVENVVNFVKNILKVSQFVYEEVKYA
ncbi:MAG: S-adenosylmethionine decarboxylase [Candidatus Bathyarchaeia archaeon]|nr:S-adenosylmethionine decarboxylase [Candidatus Bathyarchaeota archaeon]